MQIKNIISPLLSLNLELAPLQRIVESNLSFKKKQKTHNKIPTHRIATIKKKINKQKKPKTVNNKC
jgi:hypothetical protein